MTARRRENDDDDDDDKDDVVEERSSHVEVGPAMQDRIWVLVSCRVGIIARTLELRSDTHIPGADLPSHAHSDTYIPCTEPVTDP